MTDVTRILEAIGRGEAKPADELLPVVYEDLRVLAAQRLSREAPGHTLQATALVHEAYLRLVGDNSAGWDNRGHFFAAAAEAMRRILVESARRKQSIKHGGALHRVDLTGAQAATSGPDADLLAMDEALDRLSHQDANLAEIIKLRYFGGLTLSQIARILGVARRTVDRRWALGRAWLYRELSSRENAM